MWRTLPRWKIYFAPPGLQFVRRLVRFSYMTTVLSQKGQVVLPLAVRQQLRLTPGEDFEVSIEDEDTIVLRRVSHPANRGLVEHLLTCPFPFDIPEREKDDTPAISL
jgi:AbrB family looped-hinge helix DNA binding protein